MLGDWRGQRMRVASAVALICMAIGLTACGGSETTTVIREAPTPPRTVERTTTVEAPSPGAVAEHPASNEEPPNVLGLPLPAARHLLKGAGYKAIAKNTDTTFGIIVPEHYTICRQSKPRGDMVVVLAQKYGC